MNAAIQQQVVATLADAFVRLIFSNNAAAAAQKQRMMEELKARQAAAAREQQIAEAERIAAISERLSDKLKLSGATPMSLKREGGAFAGLQLKRGDGSNSTGPHVERAVVAYKSDGTPFTTINGKAVPSGSVNGEAPRSGPVATPAESAAAAVPGDTAAAPANSTAPLDPEKMNPQQLADAATAFDSLPPEEQQRLLDQAERNATLSAASQQVPDGPPSSAMGQLQQVARDSQAAASAPDLETAAAKARIGFDQAAGGATSAAPAAVSGNTVASLATAPGSQGTAGQPATASQQAAASTHAPTPIFGTRPTLPGDLTTPATSSAPRLDQSASAATTTCPGGIEKLIPTRQQLQAELITRRMQLESLRNSIQRLNRSIQLDQQQFAEWEQEAQQGYDRCVKEVWDLPSQLLLNHFVEAKEAEFRAIGDDNLTAAQKQQRRWLERAGDLRNFSTFKEWALEDENRRTFFRDGIRTLIDTWPLETGPASAVRTAEALIDNAYDYVDLVSTWDRIHQLDRNSDQFLEAVRRNGQRMRELVTRINEIEAQLKSSPQAEPGSPLCHQAAGVSAAKRAFQTQQVNTSRSQ